MRLALVGATGLVGRVMCQVLEQHNFPVTEFLPVASERSIGKTISFKGKEYPIVSMEDAIAAKPQIAIFSAGGSTSLQWAPQFAKVGTTVIDNSSAWRMEPNIPLVVPEINAHKLTPNDKIIANPNCSTIQMVLVLAPLHRKYQIDRLVISTYQSITGTGAKAVAQYQSELAGTPQHQVPMIYPHPIFNNCIPQCDSFLDNDYTKEEMKLVNETQKILDDKSLRITATTVRVPTLGGHSESVNVTFRNPYEVADVRNILQHTQGVVVVDNPAQSAYPMPKDANGKDEVFVGRIRRDHSADNALNLWIVADNLRKGAATNAIQIASYLVQNKLV